MSYATARYRHHYADDRYILPRARVDAAGESGAQREKARRKRVLRYANICRMRVRLMWRSAHVVMQR